MTVATSVGKIRLYMSMSVDGFITGPEDGPEQGLGINGERLHAWLRDGGVSPGSHRPSCGPDAEVFDTMMATGAVITGRRTFDHAGGWAGDHHNGVAVIVPTRTVPEHTELELVRAINGSDVLHLRYRVHTDTRSSG